MKFKVKYPFGPPVGEFLVSATLVDNLINVIEAESDNQALFVDNSANLAGAIQRELRLSEKLLQELNLPSQFGQLVGHYIHACCNKAISQFILRDCWVNLQQAGEYNPVHWHDSDISAVLWLRIPERSHRPRRVENRLDGVFHAVHGTRQFLSNSVYEVVPEPGKLIIFPSYLMHCVYPFEADEQRWSLAFNANIDEGIVKNWVK